MKQNFLINLYDDKSQSKIIALLVALLIGGASVFYTNYIVNKLAEHERQEIELYAKALEIITSTYSDNDEGIAINFITEQIIKKNDMIPAIITDDRNNPVSTASASSINIDFPKNATEEKKKEIMYEELELMSSQHLPIEISVAGLRQRIYYRNSDVLYQLQYYPYVQLSVIGVFVLLTYMAFSSSRRAEQNRVWVGLAKETAHQLGTPISSLMAWIEYFKSDPQFSHNDAIPELEKDVHKLQMITARFSNIGSVPTLTEENLHDILLNIIQYLQKRISSKVKISLDAHSPNPAPARINRHLFEWVIENLCKNAVDAMSGGHGEVNITLRHQPNNQKWIIDISDTGKGISKTNLKKVFEPGFSTKKRGWGLGLTLAKRIIENYHQGKIFVKSSEPAKGTTFRIVLNA
jgi:signal transduction histidine kinase